MSGKNRGELREQKLNNGLRASARRGGPDALYESGARRLTKAARCFSIDNVERAEQPRACRGELRFPRGHEESPSTTGQDNG